MAKVVTLRLTDEEYKAISASANMQHRPISNFITYMVLNGIQDDLYADSIEMDQIRSDKKLQESLKAGQSDAKKMKGRFA